MTLIQLRSVDQKSLEIEYLIAISHQTLALTKAQTSLRPKLLPRFRQACDPSSYQGSDEPASLALIKAQTSL